MEMNNLRTESHVAQKSRRHKLRFQQNSDDPTHQHLPQETDPFHRPRYGSILSYDPNVFPSEILNSVASNPHLLIPFGNSDSQNQNQHWNNNNNNNNNNVVVSYPIAVSNSPMVVEDLQVNPVFTSSSGPNYYHNTLQEVVQQGNYCADQLGFIGNNRSYKGTNDHKGLSLSLSSVPQPKPEFPPLKIVDGAFGIRNVGPLGPFTGYATILKNSKYLKPAQELLSDSCDVGGHDQLVDQTCEKILEEELSRVSTESGASGASSSDVYGHNEHISGRSGSLSESYRPEFHQKKAKLLYMQEEVCRRYKQYNQQMQMVISSFETVAGLSSATPYVSLALKSVSRHFHFVKSAISEQLSQMKKTFEDLCSPTTGTNDSLKSIDHNFQRHGKSSVGSGIFGNQQPVWRPQRGLPERAVSVLKAWLFDHFLHPYPSDADKHMLATQTGLTRNQVSNWFINARVRIWKPMVEEIHTLETKGLADSSANTNNPQTDGQDTRRMDMSSMTNKQQAESSRNSGTLTMINGQNESNGQLWDHEKRSRPEYQVPQATMDRSFTNIMPYPRTTFEAGGGVGPVSLTLGLRQNAENVQQLQQHEHQLRQRYGGQLIHDFVG